MTDRKCAPRRAPWRCAALLALAATSLPALAGLSELLSTPEARTENDIFNARGLAVVDAFSGNLTSTSRDVHLPGNGGNDISVFRRWDGSRLRARIWHEQLMYGVTREKFAPQESAALGTKAGGWSLTAAPMVSMNVSHYPQPTVPVAMSDAVDRVCTGQPFRDASGLYGVVVVYTLTLPTGENESLIPVETGAVQSRSGWRLTCTGGQGGTHILRSPSGDKYTLGKRVWGWNVEAVDGVEWATLTVLATQKEDRNGNWLRYAYEDRPEAGVPRPRLGGITSSDGRSLDFVYEAAAGGDRLTHIEASFGARWHYAYDAQGRLASFRDPADRTWSFRYHPGVAFDPARGLSDSALRHTQPAWAISHHIQALGLPTGGEIAFEYEPSEVWGRGLWWWEGMTAEQLDEAAANSFQAYGGELHDTRAAWSVRVTRKTTSDGGEWRYAYAPSKTPGVHDVTTIQTPGGTETHRFYGEGYFSRAGMWPVFQGAYNYTWSPPLAGAWKLGLPAEVRKGTNWIETFEWLPHVHSSIFYMATSGYVGLRDEVTYKPLLGKRTVAVDGALHTTTYGNFDAHGNPQTVAETGPGGGNRTTSITYFNDTSRWVIGLRKNETSPGGSIQRTFDAKGNLTSISRDGVTTQHAYDSEGNVQATTFPRGLVHTYANYKRGIARNETQPEGVVLARSVSDAGDIESETNAEGRITRYAYDGVGRVISITYPRGAPKSVAYGATSRTVTRDGLVESVDYDPFGRPVSVTLGGIATTYRYDPLGRKTFESLPGSATGTTYTYDNLDRVTRATNPDNTYIATTYGAATRSVRNERGHITVYAHRSNGDPAEQYLMTITPPANGLSALAIARNARGQITSVRQGTITRTYSYNSRFQLISMNHPETGTTRYGRDEAGNMTSRTPQNAGTTSFVYDGRNRLKSVTYPAAPGTVQYIYTGTDKIRSVGNNIALRTFAYDDNDNLIEEALASVAVRYAYNARDQLSAITYPVSGQVVSYAPDVLGRPTSIAGYVNAITYWPSGQLKQLNHSNGTVVNYDQNARQWPSTFRTRGPTGASLGNSVYTYDAVGNLQAIADSIEPANNRTLSHDPSDRLTGASGPWGAGTITYDGVGNIKSQTLGALNLAYAYDAANRLSSVSGHRSTSFTYDVLGNVATGSGNAYTYDAVPNLVCVNCANAALAISYAYDGLNRRVTVTKAGVLTYEFNDSQGNLLAEFTPSQSNRLVEYIYLAGKRIAQRVTP